jgi:deoxyribodipyrimidine photo-lyase
MILFFYRRDFRIVDNLGLLEAIQHSEKKDKKIICVFCIDKKQVNGKYFSNRAFQFLAECLKDLNKTLEDNLIVYDGDNIFDYLKENDITVDHVFSNKDYTPYAKQRDSELSEFCRKQGIECTFVEDYTLLSLQNDSLLTNNGNVYTVFTPYYKKIISEFKIPEPILTSISMKYIYKLPKNISQSFNPTILSNYYQPTNNIKTGGRKEALDILNKFDFKLYEKHRDFPHKKANSMISAYLKFGCISIREIYKKASISKTFQQQLIWKEFYAYLTYHFPHVLQKMISNKPNDDFRDSAEYTIKWKNDKKWFKKWCDGETGFPIVDAGMRELNKTGFMHNRVRMITAMFLTKHLHIDWRWGEKYFATQLMDYDPASNNGGWQWCSGTGIDMRNYFRMFNPWTQTKRFDSKCEYIKKWIPELNETENDDILKWHETFSKYPDIYIPPIVVHETQRKLTNNEIYLKK